MGFQRPRFSRIPKKMASLAVIFSLAKVHLSDGHYGPMALFIFKKREDAEFMMQASRLEIEPCESAC